MSKQGRTSLYAGLLLVIIGGWFLAWNLLPELRQAIDIEFTWPWIIIGVGAALLFLGLLTGQPGMAVPAFIVGGIGGILYYQETSNDWDSWAYIWALIPGFVGLGVLVSELLQGRPRQSLEGLRMMAISAVLFFVFGSFLGGPKLLGDYWPVLIILLGGYLLISPWMKRQKTSNPVTKE